MLKISLLSALLSLSFQNKWLKIDSYFKHQIKLVIMTKRNRLLKITRANQILLFNSNQCKLLLETDCIRSKNFNTGRQNRNHFPTNANSCSHTTKFIDSSTQSNAKQNQFCHPNNEPSDLIVNTSQANASIANFNPVPQLTNVDYKPSIKLIPLKLQNFNGSPLLFQEWINNFLSMIHYNTGIKDTHRITYLLNSENDMTHAYFCIPSYYKTALNELINHFGDRTIVVNASINQHENWPVINQNKRSFFVFFAKKANKKVPQKLILRWTDHFLTEFHSDSSHAEFQQWLELHAQVYDKVDGEYPMRDIFHSFERVWKLKLQR